MTACNFRKIILAFRLTPLFAHFFFAQSYLLSSLPVEKICQAGRSLPFSMIADVNNKIPLRTIVFKMGEPSLTKIKRSFRLSYAIPCHLAEPVLRCV